MAFALYNRCVDEEWEEASLLLDSSTSEEAAELVRYATNQGVTCALWLVQEDGPLELLVRLVMLGERGVLSSTLTARATTRSSGSAATPCRSTT